MLHDIDASLLRTRLSDALPGLAPDQVEAYATRMVEETDERLEPNVAEWLRGEPLTDIWIDQYCIGLALKIQGRGDFLTALEALSTYARDPQRGESLIWRVDQ